MTGSRSIRMISSTLLRRMVKQHQATLTRGLGVSSTEMPELTSFGQNIQSHEELPPNKRWIHCQKLTGLSKENEIFPPLDKSFL